jgi:basic amino acid/polyamine antiporter, APA family
MNSTHTLPGEPLFARNATGLVREFSAFHALVFNASFINIGLTLLFMVLYGPSFHPGSSMMLATILGTVMAVPMAFVNAMLASIYPRSGGEYVYNSRVLSPAVGFATNFNMTVWLLFYVGVSCVLFAQYGLAELFRYVGIRWEAAAFLRCATWIATPEGEFIVGSFTLAVIILGLVLNTRRMVQIQGWYFVLGLIGVALAILALIATDKQHYAASFSSYFGQLDASKGNLPALLSEAKAQGYTWNNFSLSATLMLFFWPASFLFWGNCSTYFGGEIQFARRSQLIGNVGAVLLCGLCVSVVVVALDQSIGNESVGGITYLQAVKAGLGFSPTYAELAAIATSSRLVGLVVLLGCSYWLIAFAPLITGAMTRNLLAWSLDRVAPEFLSRVNNKTHTPVFALLVCGVIGEICIYLYAFVPAFGFAVGIVGAFLTFITTALSATVLPFTKREVFERSSVNWRAAGFPVITIFGILAVIGLLCVEVSILWDPYSGVSLFPSADAGAGTGIPFMMLVVNLAIFVSGFVVYFLAKWIRRMQGLDIDLAFGEIPPE